MGAKKKLRIFCVRGQCKLYLCLIVVGFVIVFASAATAADGNNVHRMSSTGLDDVVGPVFFSLAINSVCVHAVALCTLASSGSSLV